MNGRLLTGILILAPFLACATAPSLFASHSPYMLLSDPLAPPSRSFLLGTDELGRDLLSRLIYAARTDLTLSLGATAIAAVVGSTIGLITGYVRGNVDSVVIRATDVFMGFPAILLVILVVAFIGRSEAVLLGTLAIVYTPGFIKLARVQAIAIRGRAFVEASRISNAGTLHIATVHLLPNALAPLLVGAALTAASTLLIAAGLAYLGLGLPPPTASWGGMLHSSFLWLFQDPLYGLLPGLCITLVAIGYTWLADGIQQAFDLGQYRQLSVGWLLGRIQPQTEAN